MNFVMIDYCNMIENAGIQKSTYRWLLFLITCLVYLNSIPNQFVWDDRMNITENPNISKMGYITHLFTQSYATSDKTTYYRPLFPATYFLEYPIWKLRPWGYRLVNILLHLLVTLIVFEIGVLFLRDIFSAFLAGLLFAIHPVHVECVSWISGRVDLLCALFYFLSFYLYLRYREHVAHPIFYFVFSLLCFFLSLLSKEMGLTLPLLLILYDRIFPNKNYTSTKKVPVYTGYAFAGVIYFILRKYAIGTTIGADWKLGAFSERLLTIPEILGDYLRLLLFPFYMNADYITSPIPKTLDSRVILPLCILGGILYLFLRYRRTHPKIFYSGLFLLVTLLPVLNILPVRDPQRIEAERFLYIPSLGFCLLLPLFFREIKEKQQIKKNLNLAKSINILFILFLTFLAVRTTFRNIDWKNETVFFHRMMEDSPLSYRGYVEMGNLEMRQFHPNNAITYYQKALICDTTQEEIYENMANAYAMNEDFEKASGYLSIAFSMNPNDIQLIPNLAYFNFEQGKYDKAISLVKICIPYMPGNYFNYYVLGSAYQKKGDIPSAIEAYRKVVEIHPGYTDGWKKLNEVYTLTNESKLAEEAYSHITSNQK